MKLADRRRVPWDNRGTKVYEPDFLDFNDLRFLEPGSIPAASTKSFLESDSYGAVCGPMKTRIRGVNRE